jgi:Flp pilus assembly protein TadG
MLGVMWAGVGKRSMTDERMARPRGRRAPEQRREQGAAAVEFALVITLLLAIVGGIVDFGFMFNAQISLTHAAREGVRVEAIGTGDPVAQATAAFAAPAVTGFNATVTAACPNAGGAARVQTEANYVFFFLPFGARTLRSEAVMRCGG